MNANVFQFTPLREGRLSTKSKNMYVAGFNSRPCVRGDFVGLDIAEV